VLGQESYEDYADQFHELIAEVEARHFWFAARRRVIVTALRRVMGELRCRTVLDVGCGTGFVLAALEEAGMVGCGLDASLAGLRKARRRVRCPLVCATPGDVPFQGQFDAVTVCDVIEHVPDDVSLLREAARAVRDDGVVLVTVPAGPSLWTTVDAVSGHKRRYTRSSLLDTLRAAGLRPDHVAYFNRALYPVQLMQRLAASRPRAHMDRMGLLRRALAVPAAPLNALLHVISWVDAELERVPLPFGTSLIAVAHLSDP